MWFKKLNLLLLICILQVLAFNINAVEKEKI